MRLFLQTHDLLDTALITTTTQRLLSDIQSPAPKITSRIPEMKLDGVSQSIGGSAEVDRQVSPPRAAQLWRL